MNQRLPRPKRRFSQNFLKDDAVLYRIAEAVPKGVPIVEIGPGRGALTAHLLERGTPVIAVELDRELCPILEERFFEHEHFTLIQGDALKLNYADLSQRLGPFWLVGNLPYQSASRLLVDATMEPKHVEGIIAMVQKEVAGRIAAEEGSKKYGVLTVLLNRYFKGAPLFDVPPESFIPPPKVMSSVVCLRRRQQEQWPDSKIAIRMSEIAKQAFSQRRKQIKNTLDCDDELFAKLKISPKARPETLSREVFIALAQHLPK